MWQILWEDKVEVAAIILFGIGLTTLLLNRNLIRKIIGFSFMDSAIFLFLTAEGYIAGSAAPIQGSSAAMVNPIPAGLVLTGIVVSVSVTAVMLALTVRLYQRYHTLDFDEICRLEREKRQDPPGREGF